MVKTMINIIKSYFKKEKYYVIITDNSLYIKNYKKVIYIEDSEVLIEMPKMIIEVTGSSLILKKIIGHDLAINGTIESVKYL